MTFIHERVTEYTVSALPEDLCVDASAWDLTVAYRGKGRWAVLRGPFCCDRNGRWYQEPLPSSRTESWLKAHRFSEQEALELARREAPGVTINGITATDLLAKYVPQSGELDA